MKSSVADFLCQALEQEQGGVLVYQTALSCARNKELKEEWQKYLEETEEHVEIYTELIEELGLDPEADSSGRAVVRRSAEGLIELMEMALKAKDPPAAELVAAECVLFAETKCHMNWELVGQLGEKGNDDASRAFLQAHAKVEQEEDEHLYHTMGWARELWIQHLGMPAVLPPPEEEKDVKTAIGAARAKHARKAML